MSQFIINIDVCVIIFGAYWVWELSRKETTTSRPLCYSHPNLQSWKTTLIRHNFVWIWFLINSHEMNMKTGFFFSGYSRLLVPRHLWAQLPKAYKTPTPISHVKSSAHFTTEHSSTHWRAVCITINTPGRIDTPKSVNKNVKSLSTSAILFNISHELCLLWIIESTSGECIIKCISKGLTWSGLTKACPGRKSQYRKQKQFVRNILLDASLLGNQNLFINAFECDWH